MIESPPSCNTNCPGNPGPIDPQATFNVFAMVVLSGTMIVTPFLRLGVGSRYFVGIPTIGAFLIQGIVCGYARTNLDIGLMQLWLSTWMVWVPIRVLLAGFRCDSSLVHSQYNGWPLVCALFRGKWEGFAKLVLEPGICVAFSFPWAHRAPVFSGMVFFVGGCLFASHALSNHLMNRRAQSLVDSEIEQRQAMSDFRRRRGLR